jgi:hypothetical protein
MRDKEASAAATAKRRRTFSRTLTERCDVTVNPLTSNANSAFDNMATGLPALSHAQPFERRAPSDRAEDRESRIRRASGATLAFSTLQAIARQFGGSSTFGRRIFG